jgi:hypothetical protein
MRFSASALPVGVLAGSKDGPADIFFARIGPGRPARPLSPVTAQQVSWSKHRDGF